MAKTGRPEVYTTELGDEICNRLSAGETLIQICKDEHLPCRKTIYNWLSSGLDEFLRNYTQAKDQQAEYYADQCIDIADQTDGDTKISANGLEKADHEWIHRSQIRIDTRKWYATVTKPRKYDLAYVRALHEKEEGARTINVNLNVADVTECEE
jgi:hypothetical protein